MMQRTMQLVLRVKRSSGLLHQFSTAANSQRLAGKVAVITGAASGIGKASAKEFIGNGAKVILADVQHAARAMVPRRSGCVLFTGSVSGVVGGTGPTSYGVSKAAVLGVVRAVAGELARHGVRANAVSPCGVATPLSMVQVLEAYPGMSFEELKNAMAASMEQMEAGPLIDPEDVARTAVFLASDEARYINGHNLVVDGGFTVGKLLKIPKE
uniref:Uncharacterized protein n=1 Tax=Oryza glumipatula TaxID=40148 RepID=A0A0E0ANY1_9ORYZ